MRSPFGAAFVAPIQLVPLVNQAEEMFPFRDKCPVAQSAPCRTDKSSQASKTSTGGTKLQRESGVSRRTTELSFDAHHRASVSVDVPSACTR